MPPRIWNAFPQRRGSGGGVRYLRQTGTPGGAAVVDPGDVKPTAAWGLSQQDDPFKVLAVISPNVANSVIADSGNDFDSFLNSTLSAAVYRALDGYTVTELTAKAGKTQAFATDAITSIRKAVTQLEIDGFEASHLFVSPADNEALSLDTDAEDRYRSGARRRPTCRRRGQRRSSHRPPSRPARRSSSRHRPLRSRYCAKTCSSRPTQCRSLTLTRVASDARCVRSSP